MAVQTPIPSPPSSISIAFILSVRELSAVTVSDLVIKKQYLTWHTWIISYVHHVVRIHLVNTMAPTSGLHFLYK